MAISKSTSTSCYRGTSKAEATLTLQLSHEPAYRALRVLVDSGQFINPSHGEYRLRGAT